MNSTASRSELVTAARRFATQAHRRINHVRKYTQKPYEIHLKAVAELVATVSDDPEMLAAAWLHDTVEDTPATLEDIEAKFGGGVAALVAELTDVSKPGDGNRSVRKAIDREHTARASARAKTVKLADLIDNCRDICRGDPGFARVYVVEMAALLEVLSEGHPRLLRKAEQVLAECAGKLGLGALVPLDVAGVESPRPFISPHLHHRSLRLFTEAFTAEDIAEPLPSFDASMAASQVERTMAERHFDIAAVRRDGMVGGYLRRVDLGNEGLCGEIARRIKPDQQVDGDTSLADVIHVLTRHDACFVGVLGVVGGVIRRVDIQKPIVRMWLFGIITLIEITVTERLATVWPDEEWTALLAPGRLAKARALREERERRGQDCNLVDCLQLSDKVQVMVQDPDSLASFGFSTRSAAKQVIKELESLRNNLAHAQDIVTHDWPQIVRMAHRVQELIAR